METEQYHREHSGSESEDSDRNGLVSDFNTLGDRVGGVDTTNGRLAKRLKQILSARRSRPTPAQGEVSDVIRKDLDVDTRAPLRQRIAEMTRQVEALEGRLTELMERVDL